MGRKRDPRREKAFDLYRAAKGERKLVDIAAELEIAEGTVRGWKSKDDWDAEIFGTFRKHIARSKLQKSDMKLIKAVEKIKGLTAKQKDFCLHYVKTNNASTAARRAGYTSARPRATGYRLKNKPHVMAEIKRLKAMHTSDLLVKAEDVIELHMRIAKADMTDFAKWGRATVPVMGKLGPIETEDPTTGKKEPLMKEINEMRFFDSTLLDGQLISEVRMGKDGAYLKLVDRQKSLDFLERYFEINPMDRHKKAWEDARLELEQARLELRRKEAASMNPPDDERLTGVLVLPEVRLDEGGELKVISEGR